MALVMPSRFACLKIEDDDYSPRNVNKNIEKKKPDIKQNSSKKSAKTTKKSSSKQGTAKTNPVQSKKKANKLTEQWEQWKMKDNEIVDDHYKEELSNAILISKLEYEEIQKNSERIQMENEKEQKNSDSAKKNKKKKSMSLEQFNNMVSVTSEGDNIQNIETIPVGEHDNKFFERVKFEAEEELLKDKSKEILKVREPYNDLVTISQFQAELEKERTENIILRRELEKARREILSVKERNTKLYSILQQGEMRNKAEIMTEVERLERVQQELTTEIAHLHEQLEQERSKVGALTHDSKHKDKLKARKSVRFNVASEVVHKK